VINAELCVVKFFAITCIITAVVFVIEAGLAQAVPAHRIKKKRDSISGSSKRLFSSLKRPAWLLSAIYVMATA
jgi:hypothetical protein